VSRAQRKAVRQKWLQRQRMRHAQVNNYTPYAQRPMAQAPQFAQYKQPFPPQFAPPMYPQRMYQQPRQFPQMQPMQYPPTAQLRQFANMPPQFAPQMRQPVPPQHSSYNNPQTIAPANPSGPVAQGLSGPQHTHSSLHGSVPVTGGSVPVNPSMGLPSGTNMSSAPQTMYQQQRLTLADLQRHKPPEQKRMIGERLFPLISRVEPRLAGKITGMLLEMDNNDLLTLLDNNEALMGKVNEALQVLREHQQQSAGNQPPGRD
jgi:polyadenylate-binding protein